MAIEKLTNLRTSMEVLNGQVIFTSKTNIDFKDCKDLRVSSAKDYEEILKVFSDIIIKALYNRANNCFEMLERNQDNIVFVNEYRIVFKKNNGSYHSFNFASYTAMEDAISLIESSDYNLLSRVQYDQIAKALYWIEKPENRNNFSFGNLISVVNGMIMCL